MYCPQCGTLNNADSLFCVKCNARLPIAQAGGDELPPWLREPDDLPAESASNAPTGIPDWLQSAPANDAPVASSAELPPWLRDVEQPPARIQAPSDLPPWLSELQSSSPQVAEQAATPAYTAPEQPLPSWLTELQDDAPSAPIPVPSAPAPTVSTNDIPSWLQDDTPTTSPAMPAANASGDLPDWLRADAPSAPVPTPSAPAPTISTSDIPSWLQDDTPIAPAPAVSTSDIPSWLQDDTPIASPTIPAMSEEVNAVTSSDEATDIPDWMQELRPKVEAPPPPKIEPAPPAQRHATGDLPAWLRDFDSEPPVVDLSEDDLSLPSTTSDVPSWLAADASTPTQQSESDLDAPSWLTDLPVAQPTISLPESSASVSADIPSWLQQPEATIPPLELNDVSLDAPMPNDDIPDWLKDVDAQAQAAVQSAATNQPSMPATDVPDWLRDDSATASTLDPTKTTKLDDAGDIPAWMRDDTPSAPAQRDTASDIPDWLRQDDTRVVAEPSSSKVESASDLPDWLRQDVATPASVESSMTTKLEDAGDIPAWLSDELPSAPPPAQTPALTTKLDETGDIPAWLQDDVPSSTSAQASATTKLDEAGDIPAWLRDDVLSSTSAQASATTKLDETGDVPAWLRDETAITADSVSLEAADDVPEWLRDATTTPPTIKQDQPTGDLPAWLRDEAPVAPTPQSAMEAVSSSWLLDDEPTAATSDNAMLGNVDLPAWLRQSMPAEEVPLEEPATPASSSDWLRMLGGAETTTVSETASEVAPRRYALDLPPIVERTPQRIAAADLLQELIVNPLPAAVSKPAPAPQTWWQKFGLERLIALLLTLAIIIGLLVPNLGLGSASNSPLGGKATDLHTYIESLNPDSHVLVAFEADLRHSGELQPLQNTVLDHLVQKQVPMLLVSTDQQGTLVQAQVATNLRNQGRIEGENFLSLSYLPGDRTGIALLGQDIRQEVSNSLARQNLPNDVNFLKIMSRVNSKGEYDSPLISGVQDLDLLVIVSDHPDDVQAWLEQFWSRDSALPVAILATNETYTQIQPLVQINRNRNQQATFYPVAGITGAQHYNALRNPSSVNGAGFNALTLASLVTVGLLLIGGIVGLQRRIRTKRNAP